MIYVGLRWCGVVVAVVAVVKNGGGGSTENGGDGVLSVWVHETFGDVNTHVKNATQKVDSSYIPLLMIPCLSQNYKSMT